MRFRRKCTAFSDFLQGNIRELPIGNVILFQNHRNGTQAVPYGISFKQPFIDLTHKRGCLVKVSVCANCPTNRGTFRGIRSGGHRPPAKMHRIFAFSVRKIPTYCLATMQFCTAKLLAANGRRYSQHCCQFKFIGVFCAIYRRGCPFETTPYCICYTSLEPAGTASSSMTRFSLSPRSAESSIPQLSWPIIFRGARLVTATRVFPINCSGS